jgi:uncharacterized protein YbjT (DUF2867 family)
MSKIFVTGSTGFVGKRLILTLLSQGHEVYALCRAKGTKLFVEDQKGLHYLWGDLRDSDVYKQLPSDLDAAYYLVHSMTEIVNDLGDTEVEVVEHFLQGIKPTKIKQIIYLGGIINDEKTLSPHLRSRLSVEKALKEGQVSVTVLRASIIIGSGSASFEIIRDLCEKIPIMIAPKWVHTSCQPMSIRDVLFYLAGVLLNERCFGKTFDIGGPDVLTFKELMLKYSEFRHLRTWVIDVPVLTPRLSSYWLVLITSVRLSLCSYLVESMKNSSVVKLTGIEDILPHECLKYTDALELAFEKISKNEVISTWMDSFGEELVPAQVPKEGCLKDEKRYEIKGSKEDVIRRIWSIGGDKGYYALNWAWHIRGLIDQMLGGIGLNRGRRHPTEIMVGDSIDFWRVLCADKVKGHLILLAMMKVPGEAWLEFQLEQKEGKWILLQRATFRPLGLWGRLYWYSMYPFHFFIFRKMAQSIAGIL